MQSVFAVKLDRNAFPKFYDFQTFALTENRMRWERAINIRVERPTSMPTYHRLGAAPGFLPF
jgi:hypothetical protein